MPPRSSSARSRPSLMSRARARPTSRPTALGSRWAKAGSCNVSKRRATRSAKAAARQCRRCRTQACDKRSPEGTAMQQHETSRGERVKAWLVLAGLLLGAMPLAAGAQNQPAPARVATPAAPSETAVQVDANDLGRLVAPVALYPDPLLALILQASVQPLQVVQAERFLAKRANDSSLAPDPDWDPSILGLLNYPALIGSMSQYLDWTQTMGDAVVDRLPEVQDAVQQLRWSAYRVGLLGTTEHQQVVIQNDVIRIMPADADTIAVPTYDPEALLVAIAAAPEAEAMTVGATAAAAPGEAGQGQAAASPTP